MVRITDKINKAKEEKRIFFSFEFFPPKTPNGVRNLYARLDHMAGYEPAWIDVTWGAGGSTADLTLEICTAAQNYIGLETMMHLTCTNIDRERILQALKQAKSAGIDNILALRGDPPRGQEWVQTNNGFAHAVDLVRFIRQEYGNSFGICVAGYPEGHPDSGDREADIKYLKEKVDAGADLVITQLFYDTSLFLQFVKDCRAAGINCPILPGIMPIQSYAGFKRMTTLCKTHVPKAILDALEPIQNDDAAVKAYGVKLCIQMCRELIDAGIPGLHFYTLNLEKSVAQILDGLGLIQKNGTKQRILPWRTSAGTKRLEKELVRPIFWSNRPASYMSRTASWDDFPNGRWGDSRSPAYGELNDYHLASGTVLKQSTRLKMWGSELTSERDVWKVFVRYCKGEIGALPWNDSSLSPETEVIASPLVRINENGFLTINSQPRVNGEDSSDPRFGWGGAGGNVYQKAYVELFTSASNYEKLLAELANFPTHSYIATNVKGEIKTNLTTTCAVTWGVFPGREIIQPTVVDPDAFLVWKDEAFGLWKTQWASIYPEDSGSHKLIMDIVNSYYLIAIVDNNYISGNIFAVFDNIIAAAKEQKAEEDKPPATETTTTKS